MSSSRRQEFRKSINLKERTIVKNKILNLFNAYKSMMELKNEHRNRKFLSCLENLLKNNLNNALYFECISAEGSFLSGSYWLIEDGTAIGMGLATSVSRLKESTADSKVIILLTDGENNSGFIDPMTAVELAQESNVKVYTIGVGSYGTAPYPKQDLWGRDTYVNIEVKIDEELLINIAEATNGMYFRANNKDKLEKIYEQIEGLEKTELEELKFYNYEELFDYYALIALILMFSGFLLQYTLLKSIA